MSYSDDPVGSRIPWRGRALLSGLLLVVLLTGDRAGDLQAFVTQYRALLTAAGTGIDATKVAMATSDLMTQSVGEQHTVFLSPDAFGRFRASLTSDEGRVGLGILIQGQVA